MNFWTIDLMAARTATCTVIAQPILQILLLVVATRGVLASTAEQFNPNIKFHTTNDWECNNELGCSEGEYCSEGVCKECLPCPDPYNRRYLLGESGTLYVNRKCYDDGMCPRLCSKMILEPEEEADIRLCKELQNACNKMCNNGGTRENTCRCSCIEPWDGSTCSDCSLDCGDKGTLVESSCNCSCHGSWTGCTCTECDIRCENGGTLRADLCQCQCANNWAGTTCSECRETCSNRGRLNTTSCDCQCSEGWTGKSCTECRKTCINRGRLNTTSCECKCSEGWTGKPCTELDDRNFKLSVILPVVFGIFVLFGIYILVTRYLDCRKIIHSSQDAERLIETSHLEFELICNPDDDDDDSVILRVTNWQGLECTKLETCSCLRMNLSKDDKYIPITGIEDRIRLPTKIYHLVPNMTYSVRAGKLSGSGRDESFETLGTGCCTFQGTTEENGSECSTTIENVLDDSGLCKSLYVELNDRDHPFLAESVAEAFKLPVDKCRLVKDAERNKQLDTLRDILMSRIQLSDSIHVLMKHLKDVPEAGQFIEKLARHTLKNNRCSTCMLLLHQHVSHER